MSRSKSCIWTFRSLSRIETAASGGEGQNLSEDGEEMAGDEDFNMDDDDWNPSD